MRTLFLVPIFFIPLTPSLAQDQNVPSTTVAQPAERQPGSSAVKGNGQKNHTLERMGPGIDWDHRKPGRGWKVAPAPTGGKVERD